MQAIENFFSHIGLDVEPQADFTISISPADSSALVTVVSEAQGVQYRQVAWHRGKKNSALNTAVELFGLRGELDEVVIACRSGQLRVTESREVLNTQLLGRLLDVVIKKTKQGKEIA